MHPILLATQNISNYTSDVIGLIGTLAGTVLGWLLHFLSDNAGRTQIMPDEFCDRKAEHEYAYIIKIMIYNTSHKKDCMRNVRFSFCNKWGKELFESKPGEGKCTWETVRSKNEDKSGNLMLWIDSFTPVEFTFSGWLERDRYNQLASVRKIYLKYENRRKCRKKVVIKKKFDINNVDMWKWKGFT